jgi:hypothetical protein
MQHRLYESSQALWRADAAPGERRGAHACKDPRLKRPKRGDVIAQASRDPMLFFGDLG